jgi:hypothetical protein
LHTRKRLGHPARIDSDLGRRRPHDSSNRQQRLAEVVTLEIVVFIATQAATSFSEKEYRSFGIGVDLTPGAVGRDVHEGVVEQVRGAVWSVPEVRQELTQAPHGVQDPGVDARLIGIVPCALSRSKPDHGTLTWIQASTCWSLTDSAITTLRWH